MVDAKDLLSRTFQGHLMLVLAANLRKDTNTVDIPTTDSLLPLEK